MSGKHYKIEDLGCSSWLELFKIVEAGDCLNERTVSLVYPEDQVEQNVDTLEKFIERPKIEISVDYIRAKAFSELYEKLPSLDARDTVVELLKSDDRTVADIITTIDFLNKIPTRTI